MFALAKELAETHRVVTTTTTKILPPTSSDAPRTLLNSDEVALLNALCDDHNRFPHVTVAAQELTEGKLKGVSPEFVDRLVESKKVDVIIVEADGAKGRPLKFPNAGEPVVPSSTSLLIPVVGIDAAGQPFNEETVFRAHLAEGIIGFKIGDSITTEFIAALVTHPKGVCKNVPKNARIIPFINKVEDTRAEDLAEDLASRLKKNRHYPIDCVMIGSVYVRHLRRNC